MKNHSNTTTVIEIKKKKKNITVIPKILPGPLGQPSLFPHLSLLLKTTDGLSVTTDQLHLQGF